MLARVRLSHAAIRDELLQLDDAALSVDNLKAIKHCCPTEDEAQSLRSYEGEIPTLTSADQFFHEVSLADLPCVILPSLIR